MKTLLNSKNEVIGYVVDDAVALADISEQEYMDQIKTTDIYKLVDGSYVNMGTPVAPVTPEEEADRMESERQAQRQDSMEQAVALQVEQLASTNTEQALALKNVFPDWMEKKDGDALKSGQHLTYKGKLYRVLQKHNKQSDWSPDVAVSLFVEVRPAGVVQDWQRPPNENPYKIGDRVRFNGKIYESTINVNTWSPSEYPAGWKEVV